VNAEVQIDRSGWPSGQWDDEPDRVTWRHVGFDCIAQRNRLGAWCGYVGIPRSHPWYERDDDAIDPWPEVHGGLTWSGATDPPYRYPIDGREEPLWWVGFDCAHLGDWVPGLRPYIDGPGRDEYRDVKYATKETNALAEQALAAGGRQ
jgi:hypothetical protein